MRIINNYPGFSIDILLSLFWSAIKPYSALHQIECIVFEQSYVSIFDINGLVKEIWYI